MPIKKSHLERVAHQNLDNREKRDAAVAMSLGEMAFEDFSNWWDCEAKSVRDFCHSLQNRANNIRTDSSSTHNALRFLNSFMEFERNIDANWQKTWKLIGV